jgi:hypothetical protein
MVAVLEFKALKPGGDNKHSKGDMLVTVTGAGGSRHALSVRLTEAVLDTLRWRANDRVTWTVEFHEDRQVWRFERTDDADQGLKLSGTTATKNVVVKRTVTPDIIAKVFCRGHKSYTGSLDSGDKTSASFVVKYDEQ